MSPWALTLSPAPVPHKGTRRGQKQEAAAALGQATERAEGSLIYEPSGPGAWEGCRLRRNTPEKKGDVDLDVGSLLKCV